MDIITADMLLGYLQKDKRRFEELLPELIKKLIISESNPSKIRIPGRSDIGVPGFDGTVQLAEATQHVAKGVSYWEFGTQSNCVEKINSDYKKRTSETDEETRKNTSFYLVTPRKWSKKNTIIDWESNHNDWASTKVYDGIALAEWINSQPNVCAWLMGEFGDFHPSFCSLKDAWNQFSNRTSPAFVESFFLCDRDDSKDKLTSVLDQKDIIRVKSDFFYDSLGFVIAALYSDTILRELVIVVNDYDTYKLISNTVHNHIIVLNFYCDKTLYPNNHTIICYGKKTPGIKADLVLSPMIRRQIESALKSMGISQEKSSELYRKTRGNINALMRIIPGTNNVPIPIWTKESDLNLIYPLLFLQSIKRNEEKWIVESLSTEKYEVIDNKYKALSLLDDSPVRLIGGYYQIINFEEVWDVLRPDSDDAYFSKLINTITELGAKSTSTEDMYNNNSVFLQLLTNLIWYSYGSSESSAFRNAIITLLDQRKENKLIYKSLYIFAEADPDDTLNAINQDIADENSYIYSAFKENEYAPILMAIDELTTHESTVHRACELLNILAELEVSYYYSNNPRNSLATTLSLINTYSALTADEKSTILKSYIAEGRCEEIQFVVSILVNRNFYRSSRVGRDDFEAFELLTIAKYHDTIFELSQLIINKCNELGYIEPITELINNYRIFNPEQLSALCDDFDVNSYDSPLIVELNYAIRQKSFFIDIDKNREYYNALCAWNNRTTVADPLLKFVWVFKEYYHCLDRIVSDRSMITDDEKAFVYRKKVLLDVISLCGIEKAAHITEYMDNNNHWGKLINSITDKSFVIDSCKYALKLEKYLLAAGCLDNMPFEWFTCLFGECTNSEREKVIPHLYRRDILNSLSEHEMFLYWSNKTMHSYSESDFNSLLEFNPYGLMQYCYIETEKNLEGMLDCVIDVFRALIDFCTKRNIKGFSDCFVEPIVSRVDSIYYSQEWAKMCLKLQEMNLIEDNSEGINRFYFENPSLLLEIYKKSFGLYDRFRFPSAAFDNYDLFRDFCIFFKNANKDYYAAKAISYSFNCKGNVPDFVLDYLEEQHSCDFDNEIADYAVLNGDLYLAGDGSDSVDMAKHFEQIARAMNPRYQHGKTVFLNMSKFYLKKSKEERINDELH